MMRKRRLVLPFFLLLGILATPGFFPLWAEDQPPIETTREFNKKIKVTFNQTDGFPETVAFYDDYGFLETPVTPGRAWICTSEIDQGDIFTYDPNSSPQGVECYEIKNAGPRSSGCPIFANPTYYLYGADAYRR